MARDDRKSSAFRAAAVFLLMAAPPLSPLSGMSALAAEGLVEGVKEGAVEVGQGAKELGMEVGEAAKKAGIAVGEKAKEVGKEAGKAFKEAGEEIRDGVQGKK